MNIKELIKLVKKYNPDEVERVTRAYEFASKAHEGQFRESGEPYIIHPVNVTYNLAMFHADGASLVAGMLHDVVEDTPVTLKDIEKEFGDEVARLVDGVTKISNMHFSTKADATSANIRRLINSLNEDVRIIIIKLCDRLHNMQTLHYKSLDKQIRNAQETLHIFVPLAYFIGAFRLKCDLEDLCLEYIDNDSYELIKKKQEDIKTDYMECVNDAINDIKSVLKKHHIKNDMRCKVMNIYQIYKKLTIGYKLNDIHDLVNIKIMVPTEEDCYKVLGYIHKLYRPINDKFKDYIASPKTNKYSSLHTTVFGPDNHLLQIQIKTFQMDEINTFGLAAYWLSLKGEGKNKMQNELKLNYQFFDTIRNINEVIRSDSDFIDKVKQEIFSNNIYVYTLNGDIIELPKNSSVIDFAYKLHPNIGNHLYKAYVNGRQVKLSHSLKNKDRIMVITKETSHPNKEWLKYISTIKAKELVMDYLENGDVNQK